MEWKHTDSATERLKFADLALMVAERMNATGLQISAAAWVAGYSALPQVTVFSRFNPDELGVIVRVRPAKRCVPIFGLAVRIHRDDVAAEGLTTCLEKAADYLAATPWCVIAETEETPAVWYSVIKGGQ